VLFEYLLEVHDPEPHPAALNMAIDEALLRAAQAPMLRIYRWARPAVSFGYFGKWAEVQRAWPDRDAVRRWTGGGIVPHGDDITYSLIVPNTHPFARLGPVESYRAIHEVLAAALGNASLATRADPKISEACFENAVQDDVVLAGRKIAGAAQRRSKRGLLHQGSIQPVSDPGAMARALPGAFARQVEAMPLASETCSDASRLVIDRYGTREWLHRR
jgi:lipoate-protein ligase A